MHEKQPVSFISITCHKNEICSVKAVLHKAIVSLQESWTGLLESLVLSLLKDQNLSDLIKKYLHLSVKDE